MLDLIINILGIFVILSIASYLMKLAERLFVVVYEFITNRPITDKDCDPNL